MKLPKLLLTKGPAADAEHQQLLTSYVLVVGGGAAASIRLDASLLALLATLFHIAARSQCPAVVYPWWQTLSVTFDAMVALGFNKSGLRTKHSVVVGYCMLPGRGFLSESKAEFE